MKIAIVTGASSGMVMNSWLNQQEKPKNNTNLTVEGHK